MSEQKIFVGTVPNDGTGDPLRTAFIKTESNFEELYGDNANVVNSILALFTTTSTLTGNVNTINAGLSNTNANLVNVYTLTNSAFVSANTAGLYANTAGIVANGVGYYANTVLGISANNYAGAMANAANSRLSGSLANVTNTVFNGNFITTNGVYAINNYTGPYVDGIVMDYVTGIGRLSMGTLDGFSFYTGGVGTTLLTSISSTGSLTTSNGFYSLGTFNGIFSDGIVMDYVDGNGRISVGGSDSITFYNSGVAAVPLATMKAVVGAGYFGIGTINPAAPFTVVSNSVAQIVLSGGLGDFEGSLNSTIQLNIRNANTGIGASSDLVATADNGTDNNNYIDLGINGSGYSQASWTINGAVDGYLYTNDGGLAIGTANTTVYKPLQFFVGGTLASNEAMRITKTAGGANVGIGTTTPAYRLDVAGSANISLPTLLVAGQNVLSSISSVKNRTIASQAAAYGLTLNDCGTVIAAGATLFVPNAVFYAGNTLFIYNNTTTSITITQNTNVSLRAGGLTTGNRTLASNGYATLTCVQGIESGGNTFVMMGNGIT
jgi:hypothetical protein